MKSIIPAFLILLPFWLHTGSAVYLHGGEARPNIVLILTDDQGYHDVGYYGTEDLRTPNIDQLCRSGMRFDRFYANSSVCSPTRAALMTGRFSDLAGVPGVIRSIPEYNWGYLDPEAILLPEVLKKVGYATALIGKWHLGLEEPNLPNARGFDHFHGMLEGMMDNYWTHARRGEETLFLNREPIEAAGHATDLFTRWAVEYIQDHANSDQPFILYLAYNAPHFPVQPPESWLEAVLARDPLIDKRRAGLVAFIEHIDHGIGRVMEALGQTGIANDTLVIFSSDNGGRREDRADNGPLRGYKRDMYEGGLRVPTCMAWPGVIAPGSASDAVAATMDLYPTLCDVAGAEIPEGVDGISLLPVLRNAGTSLPLRPLFFVRREGDYISGGLTNHAVRYGDYKLVKNTPNEPYGLYNLADDPMETSDLARKRLETYAELHRLMMEHIRQAGAVSWQPPEMKPGF